VDGASELGMTFVSKNDMNVMTIKDSKTQQVFTFELLNVLPFDS